MTGSDAPSDEMPRVPFPGRVGRDQDELLLDFILDRRPLPSSAPAGMLALADSLVGLAAPPPGTGELPGEAAALAAFIGSGSPASTMPLAGEPQARQRRPRLTAGRARLSAAIAVIVVGLSGTAAAYAGVLPASVQGFAHRLIGAPAAHHAVHHAHGAARHRADHPGPGPAPPHAGGPVHRAKPGQEKAHKGRGRLTHTGKPATKPKPPHRAHPSPRAHPSRSPSPGSHQPSPGAARRSA